MKRVEAALAGTEPLLTPPRSSTESPDRSSSPESESGGAGGVGMGRDVMSLPIRKRKLYMRGGGGVVDDDDCDVVMVDSRMDSGNGGQRQSSVIQFAKAN